MDSNRVRRHLNSVNNHAAHVSVRENLLDLLASPNTEAANQCLTEAACSISNAVSTP